ncbi:MAG: TonB-dependent receptor domain-containing protein [Bryobacteraceae bacterium]
MMIKNYVYPTAAVACLLCVNAIAQSTATISGTVSDQGGGVIPGANIVITNLNTERRRTIQTDGSGLFYAPALPSGTYKVTVTAPGFETVIQPGITLTVGLEQTLNLTLKPSRVQEQVEVLGEPPPVQTSNASVTELVDSQKVRALPLNGRSFDQLIYLQPGVNVATSAGSSPNQGRGVKFSVGGARLTSNVFMLDGTDLNDSQNFTPGGAGGQLLGVESILEFQVISHNAGAQYGRSMGGIINAVSKSGTNAIHGDLYEFLRNSAFDAKNYFDDPASRIPAFERNQFGAAVGGPILRNRLFYFGNYEGLRERLGVSKFGLVPDLNARQGIISGQAPIQVKPEVIPYLNLFPVPNGPSAGPGIATVRFSQKQPSHGDYVTGKVDWAANAKHSVFIRYTIDNSNKLRQDALDHVLGLFAENERHRNQYVTLSTTQLFSSALLNSARFGVNRSVTLVDLFNQGNVPADLSFIPGQPFGRIGVRGLSTLGATINDPRYFRMTNYQPADDLSIVRGTHTLKLGVSLERFQWNTANFNRIGGDYIFDSLSSFLKGSVQSVQVPFPGSEPNRGIRAILFGTYLQDDYRVSSRLTLNAGLRYELTTVPTEVNGKMYFLRAPSAASTEVTQPFKGNHLNFAPRFGFAFDPQGRNTSIRGGFGMYYDQILLNQFLNLFDRNPPLWLTVTLAGANAPFPHPLSAARLTPSFTLQNALYDDFKTPYLFQYHLTVQHALPAKVVASIGYVGSTGRHLIERYDANTPIPTVLPDGSLFTPATAQRRIPQYGELQTRRLSGMSYYNSMQLSVVRRSSNGLQAQASYTFSRSIDTGGGLFSEEASNAAVGVQNPDNIFGEKGLSNFDIRHNLVLNALYELPFGRSLTGFGRQLVQGWGVGSIVTLASGVPFTVENSGNRSQSKLSGASFADRPDLAPGASNNPTSGVSRGCAGVAAGTPVGTPTLYFDPCAFVPQPLGRFGNLGRNTLIGPGVTELDVSVVKHFRVTETKDLQFRAECFNVANHPNFQAPSTTTRQIFNLAGQLSSTAGVLTQTTTSSRQIQFALKLLF